MRVKFLKMKIRRKNISFFFRSFTIRFYCDSSEGLDEHNRTHSPNTFTKLIPEQCSIPIIPTTTAIKSTEIINNHTNNNSEKSTPPSKAKVHRCRQCSFVSSVKVCLILSFFLF